MQITTAQSFAAMSSARPLLDVARDQVNCRTLSTGTRDYFRTLVTGIGTPDVAEPTSAEDAFFEAAASMVTRYGQSMSRRRAVADLARLRAAVSKGESLRTKRLVSITVTVAVDDAPHDVADTVAEYGDSIRHWTAEAYSVTDDHFKHNALEVVDITTEQV